MVDINIKLEAFEGPLELLYHLIEKNEIDIYDIPISSLTDQYMEIINRFPPDMESLSVFLVMAASLLEIKSKMLLPSKNETAEETDPREELVRRLLEYKRFKEISGILAEKGQGLDAVIFKEADSAVFSLFAPPPVDIGEVLDGISLNALFDAFEDVLRRKELKVDKIRSSFGNVKRDSFSVEEKINRLKNILKLRKRLYFKEILEQSTDKSEIVVTFLAVLELIKQKDIFVIQKDIFGEIIVEAIDHDGQASQNGVVM